MQEQVTAAEETNEHVRAKLRKVELFEESQARPATRPTP